MEVDDLFDLVTLLSCPTYSRAFLVFLVSCFATTNMIPAPVCISPSSSTSSFTSRLTVDPTSLTAGLVTMPDLEKLEEPTDTRAPQEFSISQRILQALCFPFVFFTFFYLLPIPLHTGRSISSLPPQIINDTAISLLGNGSLPIPPVPSSSPHILEAFSLDELEDGHWVRRETPVDPETAYGGAYRTVDLPSAWTCNAPCTSKTGGWLGVVWEGSHLAEAGCEESDFEDVGVHRRIGPCRR
jgi:hypothetical protein